MAEVQIDLGKEALKILAKHGKEMALELVEVTAIPALEMAVKKSATPIDDTIVALLKEPLKQALKDLIAKIEVK